MFCLFNVINFISTRFILFNFTPKKERYFLALRLITFFFSQTNRKSQAMPFVFLPPKFLPSMKQET